MENTNSINLAAIAKMIDQTNIREMATAGDIERTCHEAREHNFRGVCVNPAWVKLVKKELLGTDIKVICLIDPPIGDSPQIERLGLCLKAKNEGADELDVVMSLIDIKHERWEKILDEFTKIGKILPTKVIIGSGYLTDEEIRKASEIAKTAGAICVKTATSKDPLENRELGEKAQHLKMMKEAAPGLLIKASGNIRTLSDLIKMVDAGADIVGTSSGVEIMEEVKNKLKENSINPSPSI